MDAKPQPEGTGRSTGLCDPRGVGGGAEFRPAGRLATLDGARLLLIDNGKLGPAYGAYEVIATTLQQLFPKCRWRRERHDLLRLHTDDVAPLAERLLAGERPDGAVFALADAGVSVQTALLALELENRGVPTAIIATDLGEPLVAAIGSSRGVPLPVVTLRTIKSDSAGRIDALVRDQGAALRDGLTAPLSVNAPEDAALFASAPAIGGAEDLFAFQDWAETAGIGDGLPLMPPLPERVEALLATTGRAPDETIYAGALTSGRTLRVRDAAAAAVMAGCAAQGFPVVLAALRAVAKPDYRLAQAAITTHPSGNAVVYSGGDPAQFGLVSGAGCLGPGHRGNATVGRAVSLAICLLFGARPGSTDLTTLGSPAEFSFCTAEHPDTPWPALASEFGPTTPGVFVLKAEAPRNLLEHLVPGPDDLVAAFASAATSISSNNAHVPGDLIVFLNPEHADIFVRAGWSRDDFREALHRAATNPGAALKGHGVFPIRPDSMAGLEDFPVTRDASDVHVVIAGAPGPQSMIALPWGYSRGQWEPLDPA